jgi:hypothetical protein
LEWWARFRREGNARSGARRNRSRCSTSEFGLCHHFRRRTWPRLRFEIHIGADVFWGCLLGGQSADQRKHDQPSTNSTGGKRLIGPEHRAMLGSMSCMVDSVDAALFNRLTGPENPRHTALTCRPKFARSSASLAGFALFIDACSAAEGTGSGSRLRRLFRHGHGLERRVAVCRENARRNFARGYPWNIHTGLKCFTRLNAKHEKAAEPAPRPCHPDGCSLHLAATAVDGQC